MSSDKKVDMFNPRPPEFHPCPRPDMQAANYASAFQPRPPEFHNCPPGACDRKAQDDAKRYVVRETFSAGLMGQVPKVSVTERPMTAREAQEHILQEQRINAAAKVGHPYRPYGVMEGRGADVGAGAKDVQKDKTTRATFTREEVLTVLKSRVAQEIWEGNEDVQAELATLIRTFERME